MALPPRPRAATFGNTANANRTRDLPPGSVVLGRYTIQKVLGRGGMATVYLAKHQQTDRLVALKLLDPEFSRDPAYVERFRREAKAAGRIRSDHVVAIYDLDAEVGGSLVLVMEFLEGQSMQGALKAGRFPVQKAISFGRQMLEGLAAAHEAGVIHRDLKPANLFVERSTTGSEKVKLLDFGISKLADASQQELTRDGQTLGTVAYMAPEQIRGKASATDPRVDLYSAGVSLFIMLTGKRPIDAEDTVQLLAAVLEHAPMTLAQATGLPFPAPLEAFIAKSLEKDPNRRFQTAIEMRDALVEAGKTIGYESTGPLSLPNSGSEPSGVVQRVPAKTNMGIGGAPPPPNAAKQTMMGIGGAPPPTMQPAGPPPVSMQSSFAPQSAPPTMPAPMPMGLPMAPPIDQADPFGPIGGGLAPPPMAPLAAPPITAMAPPAPTPAPAQKSSKAGLVILLSAVGLVALGGAGALVARSMNATPTPTVRSISNNAANAQGSQQQTQQTNTPAVVGAQPGTTVQGAMPAAIPTTGQVDPNALGAQPAGTAAGASPTQTPESQMQAPQQQAAQQPAGQQAQAPTQPLPSAANTPPVQQNNPPPAQNTGGSQPRVGSSTNSRTRSSTATPFDPPTNPPANTAPVANTNTRTTTTTSRTTRPSSNPFEPTPAPTTTRTTNVAPAQTRTTTTTTTNTQRTRPTRTRTGTSTVVPF